MSLQFVVKNLDELPEAVRPLYKPGEGGAFVLDVTGVVAEADVEGLKKKASDLLDEKKKAMARIDELLESEKLSKSRREALEQEKAKIEEEKAALEKKHMSAEELRDREFQEKLNKAVKDSDAKISQIMADIAAEREKTNKTLESLTCERDTYKGSLLSSMLKATVVDAAAEAGFANYKQSLGLMQAEGANPRIEPILDADGKPTGEYRNLATLITKNDSGTTVTKDVSILEAAKYFAGLKEHANLLGTNMQGGGGATGRNSPQGGARTITRSQFDTMDPAARAGAAKEIREGKATLVES